MVLESFVDETYTEIARATTDEDGRVKEWGVELPTGVYRVTFATGAYFRAQDKPCFYPVVTIVFDAADPGHYHVPCILSTHGYTTYRGS